MAGTGATNSLSMRGQTSLKGSSHMLLAWCLPSIAGSRNQVQCLCCSGLAPADCRPCDGSAWSASTGGCRSVDASQRHGMCCVTLWPCLTTWLPSRPAFACNAGSGRPARAPTPAAAHPQEPVRWRPFVLLGLVLSGVLLLGAARHGQLSAGHQHAAVTWLPKVCGEPTMCCCSHDMPAQTCWLCSRGTCRSEGCNALQHAPKPVHPLPSLANVVKYKCLLL